MDIHPPHAIRNIADFGVQIFTITCGIVIALGLESLMELWHEHKLAYHVRSEFDAELAEDVGRLRHLRGMADGEESWIAGALAVAQATLDHAKSVPAPPQGVPRREFPQLATAAWQSAIALQALPQIGADEARQLSKVYTELANFNGFMENARQQWIDLTAYEFADNPPDDVVRQAVGRLRVALAYAGSLAATEDRLIGDLEKARESMEKGH
jgi:hypothetical protein